MGKRTIAYQLSISVSAIRSTSVASVRTITPVAPFGPKSCAEIASDVPAISKMNPRRVTDKFPDKSAAEDHMSVSTWRVIQISNITFTKSFLIVFRQRKSPDKFTRFHCCMHELFKERLIICKRSRLIHT